MIAKTVLTALMLVSLLLAASEAEIDAVVLDLLMPGIDGFEFLDASGKSTAAVIRRSSSGPIKTSLRRIEIGLRIRRN